MPKRMKILLLMTIAFVLLLTVLSCGSGDKGGIDRIDATDLLTAGSSTNDTSDGGGGTGGVARCNNIGFGGCVDTIDFPAMTQAICENSYHGTWEPGLACP